MKYTGARKTDFTACGQASLPMGNTRTGSYYKPYPIYWEAGVGLGRIVALYSCLVPPLIHFMPLFSNIFGTSIYKVTMRLNPRRARGLSSSTSTATAASTSSTRPPASRSGTPTPPSRRPSRRLDRGRQRHSHAPLFGLYGESRMEYTGGAP
jgi:hypothetical protein